MKHRRSISLLAVALLFAVTTVWLLPNHRSAPELSLNIIDGRTLSLAQLRGRPVLVTFWATTCLRCIKEMPHLIELYHELNDAGLEIIAVAMPYDPPNQVMTLARQAQIPYPIAVDIRGEAVAAFGNVQLTPTNFLIGPEGNIVHHNIGELDVAKLRERVSEMLAGTATKFG